MARPDHAAPGRCLNLGTLARSLGGLPQTLFVIALAAGAVTGWMHEHDKRVLERAAWKQERDVLRNRMVQDQLDAEKRTRTQNDSLAKLNQRLTVVTRTAASAGQAFATTSAALHAIVDSNATAKAGLDSLEAQHGRQVLSLEEALAISEAEKQVLRDKVADRDRQLLKLRGDLAISITRADGFERQAHPGAIKRVLNSPVTHLAAGVVGYVLGSN